LAHARWNDESDEEKEEEFFFSGAGEEAEESSSEEEFDEKIVNESVKSVNNNNNHETVNENFAPIIPACSICGSLRLVDPWITACQHVACGECLVAWIQETSIDGSPSECPDCSLSLDIEALKRIQVCDQCHEIRPQRNRSHFKSSNCSHILCSEKCWPSAMKSPNDLNCECSVCGVLVELPQWFSG